MSRSTSSSPSLAVLSALAFAGSLVACAPPRPAQVTLTSADVATESPAARESTPAADVPDGERACRATSAEGGTSELYLVWSEGKATGTLRKIAPSGMITDQRVRAERHKDMIVADDPASNDLAVHAATVASKDGKRYLRAGDWNQRWVACD